MRLVYLDVHFTCLNCFFQVFLIRACNEFIVRIVLFNVFIICHSAFYGFSVVFLNGLNWCFKAIIVSYCFIDCILYVSFFFFLRLSIVLLIGLNVVILFVIVLFYVFVSFIVLFTVFNCFF